ncbi:MAG: MBL fold metallo-hydrolase [Pseudomonadota bacterium]
MDETPTTRLEEDLLLLRAPNPSPLTAEGTNTYILGRGAAVVIDPGPEDARHHAALRAALAGRDVAAILVTHSHRDHSPLARALAAETGAPVHGFGPTGAGTSAIMAALEGDLGGGEGADAAFVPDVTLAQGETVRLGEETLTALHTPGHFGNHLCFAWRGALFSGDHVMGWASTLVSPPDGDLTDFMASCALLAAREDRVYYPGHGAPVTDPAARLAWLVDHRKAREAQILAALGAVPRSAMEITRAVYTDVAETLWPAAARNVLAHLIDLTARGLAAPDGALSDRSRFTRA